MRKLIFILIALISFSQAQTIQYIGAPTTTVISRGNFRTDSIFYLPKRTKTPTDTAAFRYQISDSSLYYWTGYQWTKVQSASSFASVDTNIISTRLWRQKGIDSVQYNVGIKVNISDTASMLSPYIVGSGTSNYFPKFNASRSVIDSKLYESNLNLLFNSTTPYLTTSGISTIENNGTSAALYVLKTLDTARAYVSFGGANTMDINNLRAGDIRFYTNATLRGRFQTDGTFRLNSLTGTGSRIVVADDNGVLSATSSATGLVDTTLLSTRAYRQKGDDSLGAIIATKGSGTVTSVATGYGLSGGTITTTGTLIADTALMATRLRVGKVVDSLSLVKQNVLTNPVTGTGTTNYVPKFTGTSTIGNSQIFDNGTNVGIGTASPNVNQKLQINGQTRIDVDSGLSMITGVVPSFGQVYTQIIDNNGDTRISTNRNLIFRTSDVSERMRLSQAGELLIATTTDAGAYTLQNNGALYNTGSAILAATSGSVGIGITSPSRTLHVYRNGVSTEMYLESDVGTQAAYYIKSLGNAMYVPAGRSGQVRMFVNSADRVTFDSTGNVGIGTTTPTARLQVAVSTGASSTPAASMTFSNSLDGGHRVLFRSSTGDLVAIDGDITSTGAGTDDGLLRFSTSANGTLSEKMRITSDGNVGIGTTSPVQKFVVSNAGSEGFEFIPGASSNSNQLLSYNRATSAYSTLVVRASDYNIQIGTTAAYYINASQESLFGTLTDAGNYRVQVSGNAYVTGDAILAASSGNVGINTTSPSHKLHIVQNSTAGRLNLANIDRTSAALLRITNPYYSTDASSGIIFRVFPDSDLRQGAGILASGGSNNGTTDLDLFITSSPDGTGGTSYSVIKIVGADGRVGIGNTSPSLSAKLEVSSTTQGFLPPRMTTTQRDAISSPAAGLVIYNTTTSKLQVYTTSWTDLH